MTEEAEKEFKLGLDPIFVNEGPSGKNHGRWTHLWRVDLESKKEAQVIAEDMLIDAFDVSPDGSRVVFTARKDNRGNFPFLSELYVVKSDGSAMKRLTDNRALELDPIWAPDGRHSFSMPPTRIPSI
jgi:Tol biopolymer transport system component